MAAFAVDVAGQLAQGKAVADGERHVVDVGFEAGVGDGALDGDAVDGVGAVEQDDFEVVTRGFFFGGGLEEVSDYGLVGVKADACVLKVDDDGVEVFEGFGSGALVGVFGTVEADDGEVGGGVGVVGDVGCVFCAEDAMLGGEKGFEFDFRDRVIEDVNGAVAAAVETGLVGEEADA